MPETPPRIAVVGGTGFAGHNVRLELEEAGMTVGIFARTTGCDLLDLPTAWSKLNEFRPHYVVNCAALVGSVNYVTDFAADVVDVNMRLVLNTYKIAQQLRDVIVINPIANCGYPGNMDTYEERRFWDGPIHPSVLSYGSTRRMMWVLSKCYFDQYGVRSANLIVPNMYGPFDSTNPNKTHALNALIIKFVRAVKEDLPEIEVWGTGKPIREWLFARDFARVVRRVVEAREVFLEPVNIGQDQGYSVDDLVDELRRQTGFSGAIRHNTLYPDGTPKKVMDDQYFRQRFPDFSFTKLESGIAQTIAHYRAIL